MSYKFNVFTGNLDYYIPASAGAGDVIGPGSATDENIAVFDGVTGKLLKDGGVTVSGLQPIDGALTSISALTYVSPSFIKLTANDTYAVRTLAETLSDIGAAPALGADDNYVTNAEKTVIGNTSGANTGDQTSLTGISDTKANFNTALSDGSFAFSGDAPTAHTHELAAGATDITATAAELNILDLSGTALTAGWGYFADAVSTATWRQLLGSEINNDAGWTGATDITGKADVDQTMYIGTTAVAINRASATLNLAGIGTLGVGAITSSGTLTLAANNITMTGSIADTTNRVTKGWFTAIEVTNAAGLTIGGTAIGSIYSPLTSPTFATSITGSYLTASEMLITDADKKIVSAAVATYPSLTELSYVKGLTSAIQTQINTKAPSASPTFTTKVTGDFLTASEMLITNASKEIISAAVATYPSLTELGYVKGLSSAIQTQLAARLPLAGGTMTGDIQLGETDIKLDAVLSADEKWSGITMAGTAGATLAVGDICFLQTADSKWELVDGILDGTDLGFKLQLGICVLAANADAATEILTYGKVRSAAFPAFTVGAPVYLSDTAGDLVVAQPSTENFAIRICGYAISETDLLWNPDNSYIVHK